MNELKQSVWDELGMDSVHPLDEAIIDQVMEDILDLNQELNVDILLIGFKVARAAVKGLIDGSIQYAAGGQVTLNLAGRTFTLDDLQGYSG